MMLNFGLCSKADDDADYRIVLTASKALMDNLGKAVTLVGEWR